MKYSKDQPSVNHETIIMIFSDSEQEKICEKNGSLTELYLRFEKVRNQNELKIKYWN